MLKMWFLLAWLSRERGDKWQHHLEPLTVGGRARTACFSVVSSINKAVISATASIIHQVKCNTHFITSLHLFKYENNNGENK